MRVRLMVPADAARRRRPVGRRTPRSIVAIFATSLAGFGAIVPIALVTQSAGATSISVLKARAHQLAVEIDATQTKLGILSEEYDEATAHANVLRGQIATDTVALNHARSNVSHDQSALQRQAVDAYVDAGAATGLPAVFSSNADALPLQQTYLQAAAGNIDTTIASLQNSEITLNTRRSTLASAEAAANSNARTLADARSSAAGLEDSLNQTLSGVTGNLAVAVRAEEQRAAAQAAEEEAAAAAAARAAASPTPTYFAPTLDAAASAGGAAAVHAAETQIGVPYVWAGSDPGGGFDCSGLTMWAWGQAGVGLPHSAAAQYDSIEHIPFSDLEPGDLIFYAAYGYIYHVVMYVGGGEVIQAEETGTTIFIGPIPGGAYAAGRP